MRRSSSACEKTSSGVPESATFPLSITMTRSAARASSMKCVTWTCVQPAFCSRAMTCMTPRRPRTSRRAPGSSSTSTAGSIASAPASATRCFCPPESLVGSAFAKSCIATRESSRRTRSPIWSAGTPRFSGPKATSSSTTVVTIWSSGFWNTSPRLRRARRYAAKSGWPSVMTRSPTRSTVPSSGASSPHSTDASVDLPEPFGPSTHTRSPGATERLTSLSACTPPSKCRLT